MSRCSLFCLLMLFSRSVCAAEVYDIVVYGGTSGGVAAAVQASRMGKSVVIIEPGEHLGGLTTGGLGATDIGNKGAIGGISREFYRRLGKHYGKDEAWTFEPHAAEKVMEDLVAEHKVPVVRQRRLDLKNGVRKEGNRIVSITMESGETYAGKMFIDATYEGDVMAKAGVSYHVGREANSQYNETLNGVQTKRAVSHQFKNPVDPYRTPGDPSSGLLPGIHGDDPGEEYSGDHRVQAYNFRMCLTDVKDNQLPFPKPKGYDPLRYELLLRYIQTGVFDALHLSSRMPNGKTDTNNHGGFSTDNIGMNYDYPDGDYETRQRIFDDHVTYQQGMMWFLANDPRVPEDVRKQVNKWGLAKDEFVKTGGWPHQLYVREARRMISDYVMTQHNCQGREVAEDAVGLAAYTMDSHNTQRYVKDGKARNEGDIQVGGFPPYPIAYRSIVPKQSECSNLLVPVCLSSTHIAFGSIRMEPVFMVLGQSAATAAAQAIDAGIAVQEIDVEKLQARLVEDKQILEWTGPPGGGVATGIDPKKLPGIVVDAEKAKLVGVWSTSTSTPNFVHVDYLHDNDEGKGDKKATFTIPVGEAGRYEVRVAYSPFGNRATNVPVRVTVGEDEIVSAVINQRKPPQIDKLLTPVGSVDLKSGDQVKIEITNAGTDGHVIVDAVQLVPVENGGSGDRKRGS